MRTLCCAVLCTAAAAATSACGGSRPDVPEADYANVFEAVEAGDLAGVVRFVSEGWAPGAVNERGDTALNLAAAGGHTEIVRLLVREGAHVSLPDANGRTPLQAAEDGGQDEAVELLKELGAVR